MNIEELKNVTNLEEWQGKDSKKRSVFLLVAEDMGDDKVETCGFIAGTTSNLVDMLSHNMKQSKTVDKILTGAMLHNTLGGIMTKIEKEHDGEDNQPNNEEEK